MTRSGFVVLSLEPCEECQETFWGLGPGIRETGCDRFQVLATSHAKVAQREMEEEKLAEGNKDDQKESAAIACVGEDESAQSLDDS